MTDAKALSRLRQGDEEALGWLIERYSAYVGTIVQNILRDSMSQADVEEVTSDVFFALWRSSQQAEPLYLKGYLGRIARNMALKKLRERGQELPLEEDILVLEEDGPFQRAAQRERDAAVRRAVEALGEPDREIFLRHYYFGQTVTEIGARMGLGVSAVKSRLSRGREKLRRALTEVLEETGGD